MPYLQLDFDAKPRIRMAAKAAGLSEGAVLWGLTDLWEHVFRTKDDVVGEYVLDGCFGPDAGVRDLLANLGFIERTDAGWRIRGAKHRLFGQSEAGSAGGRKTASLGKSLRNLKQNAPKQTEAPPKHPSVGHRSDTEAHPTSSIQHPASERETGALPAGGPEWFGWAQDERTTHTGAFPEPPPPGFNGWWLGATKKATAEQLRAAWLAYLDHRWARELKPAACPFSAFAKRWAEYVPKVGADPGGVIEFDGSQDLYGKGAA